VVDQRRLAQIAAVDNSMCDSVRRDEPVYGLRIVAVHKVQLQARRARVDNEDCQPGQVQSRIS
jgi:hypothetical protein